MNAAAPLPYGSRLRRFTEHRPALTGIMALAPNHPAVTEGRSLFPSRVALPEEQARLLKSGGHNRKIGNRVQKGRWRGMPIFTLTLEERATCPRSCRHWLDCFGNKMHMSPRHMHGPALEHYLGRELEALGREHPRGFVVRLHVLGDFYSVEYVRRWLGWLRQIPQLHVFGYTAWPPSSVIGKALAEAARENWLRFAIRNSNGRAAERSTVTLYHRPATPTVEPHAAIVCPAQTDASDCCATCALCWQTQRNIAFLAH